MTDETMNLYMDKCKLFINFMIGQQWSGLSKSDVVKWLDNFKEYSKREQYIAHKLLVNLIYFSEDDVLGTLRDGIHKCLYHDVILENQIRSDFGTSQQKLSNILSSELSDSCFIPLLDSDSPHESGNYVSRLLVTKGLISASQSVFLDKIYRKYINNPFSNLIIVDDCVGSGDQMRTFWSESKIEMDGKEILLREFCSINNIKTYYITLFGYNRSIEELKRQFTDITICCVRELSDHERVLLDNSYIWSNREELEDAIMLFKDVSETYGFPLYGYKELDFAFIMHQTIPDWSLPILWKQRVDWNLLMRRKNSDV